MPIVRDFIYDTEDDSGLHGLRPTWFDNATPATGRGIAHDMLEHFKRQDNAVAGELEAIGAVLAIRLEQGWASQYNRRSDAEVLADIVFQTLSDAVCDDLDKPPAIGSCRLADEYSYAEETIQAAVDKGLASALTDLVSDFPGDQEWSQSRLAQFDRDTLVAWIRRGYRRTLRRYEGLDLYTLGMRFFEEVGRRIDQLLASEMLQHGDRVRVSLHPRQQLVGIQVNGYRAELAGYV